MKLNNLFKVLVMGGATLGVNASMAQGTVPSPVEKTPGFCGSAYEGSCVATITEKNQCAIVPAPGLECCWGTSCSE